MLQIILKNPDMIFYVLSAEVLFLILLQLRTNHLLRRTLKVRAQKKEQAKNLKEEVRKEESKIPVVKFEKPKPKSDLSKKTEQKAGINTKEMAVLQEMMTEFFG